MSKDNENELDHPCYQCICLASCQSRLRVRCDLLYTWMKQDLAIETVWNETRRFIPNWMEIEGE